MLVFKYIALHYVRYFLIILFALTLFVVGFDYLGGSEKLDISANLLIVYLIYKGLFAIDTLMPLSLVFAVIATKVHLVRTNALVSFYALGYSQSDILKPFLAVSSVLTLLFISFHASANFARADEYSKNIRKYSQYLSPTQNLFFTYQGQFIYFGELFPLQERANTLRVFSLKNGSLREVIVASAATYKNDAWYIKEADIIAKPDEADFISSKLQSSKVSELKILQGFRPKMLDQVYEGKVNFSIPDAVDAYLLLRDQKINTDQIKSSLYKIFIYPFFAPLMVVVIFFFVPISPRFANMSLFAFVSIVGALMTWTILFVLAELSNSKTIISEVGIVAPVVLLMMFALWRFMGGRFMGAIK